MRTASSPDLRSGLAEVTRLIETDRHAAREAARRLAAAHPDALEPRILLAASFSVLQDYVGAAAILKDCWRASPRPGIAFNLGYCVRQTGDYATALRHFLAGLSLDPASDDCRALAADTAAVIGDEPFARRLLEQGATPAIAFRRWSLGGARDPMLGAERARHEALVFWMKYDCHLYARLDNKSELAALLPSAASYWPRSYAFPGERDRFARERDAETWIFKPSAESGGRRIRILREHELPDEAGIVQRFIDAPWLYHDRKPNLRLMIGLPEPRRDAAMLWTSGLAYFATEPYGEGGRAATAGSVANLLRGDRDKFAEALGDLPAHVIRLEEFIAISRLPDLREALTKLAANLVADLEATGFLAGVRAVGSGFLPRFIGIDVALDARGKPWLLEIERYPGVGGVSPLTAAINHRFRSDWMDLVLGEEREATRFIPLS